MEKKKKLYIVLAAVVLLAAAGIFCWKFTFAAGKIVSRDADTVDLRGKEVSAESLEKAKEKLPEAHILWDITIGGKTFDGESTDIVTADFTADDVASFERLTELQSVDASACTSADAVLALRSALPDVNVYWNVTLCGESFDGESTEITIKDASADEIRNAIAFLPELSSLTLTDSTLSADEQLSLAEEYPEIGFYWSVTLGGKTFSCDASVLDFSGTALTEDDLAVIEEYLPCFAAAQSVNLTGCGLSDETIKAFADRHAELSVIWETELFGVSFSTDAGEIDFSDIALTIEDAADIEALLPYMPNLTKVVMCRCGISDEDMEALYERHDDVEFVWMVQVRTWGLRTDRTYFTVYNNDYDFPTNNGSLAALRYCHDMIAIDLGHQMFYDDPEMFECFPNLKYLIISNSQYESLPALSNLKNLVMLEMFWTNTSDITPLRELTNLRHLNITYKRVRDAESDLEVLSSMTWLERLWISYNMYSEEQVAALREALPNTQIVVIETLDCVSMGWRDDSEEYYNMRDALHMYYINEAGDSVTYNPFTGERSQYEDTNPFL